MGVMSCIVIFCIVGFLHCDILHCGIFCIVMFCTVMFCIVMFCIVMFCIVRCFALAPLMVHCRQVASYPAADPDHYCDIVFRIFAFLSISIYVLFLFTLFFCI